MGQPIIGGTTHGKVGGPGCFKKNDEQNMEATSKQHSFMSSAIVSAYRFLPWFFAPIYFSKLMWPESSKSK